MNKIILILTLLYSNFASYAIVNPTKLNVNILGCTLSGNMDIKCLPVANVISTPYKFEMEYDLIYSFACYGSTMSIAFSTDPYNASYITHYTSNPHDAVSPEEKPTQIKAYGTSLVLSDLNPEMTKTRSYFDPCTFTVKSIAIDLSPNTKNTLELYLKTMQQINTLIPLAKNLQSEISTLQIVFNSVDIPNLKQTLSNLKDTIEQFLVVMSNDENAIKSLNVILNEINLEMQTSPGLNNDQELRDQITKTFSEINLEASILLTNVASYSSRYYTNAQEILATIQSDTFANQDTYKNYQSKFEYEHQKSLKIN